MASTRSSGVIESDITTLIKMARAEFKRPKKKIELEWIDSGTIQVEVKQ